MTTKMYSVSSFIKIPHSLDLSTVMYEKNKFYELPHNLKETYYENQIPEVKPKLSSALSKVTY